VKFPQGIHEDMFDNFFKNCDLFIDGLDFFAIHVRSKAFQYCYEHNIPAITAAPLGLGASMLSFLPNQQSFEQYFRLNNQPPQEQILRFLTGLAPSSLHRKALVDPSRVQLAAQKAPSLTIGCELSAALCASQSFKILLKRGLVISAPKSLHFDAYTYQMRVSWRPLGAYNPLQIWQRFWVRKAFTTSNR
ncbi:MAG TPA: ThiF family adenylyltransferase, partial [Gammaproteobacteria bacterium]|nr:ThiF family adenylyltransferase [Gammaproteobacteria bacterium]